MTIAAIRILLERQQASLKLADGKLVLRGPGSALKNPELTELIRAHRGELLELLAAGESFDYVDGAVGVPANRLRPETDAITPDLLPLLSIRQDELDHIVASVPGGARAIQDVYPLTPLQEGMLFHYLMSAQGDPYLLWSILEIADRATLAAYVEATNAVIARHDILRTALRWESLREPVQIVVRRAHLHVEEIELDPADGDLVEQLVRRYDPSHYRLDLRDAPMIRMIVAHDRARDRWLAMQLSHHLTTDRTTGDIINSEIRAVMDGRGASLPAPVPYRNFVAHVRSSLGRHEHEAFFRELLAGIHHSTAPFGLRDVHRDGSQIAEIMVSLDSDVSQRLLSAARASGVGAASVLHAAWGNVLARICGLDIAVFGTVLFGRMQTGSEHERVLGPSINTLPLVVDVRSSVVDCVKRTQRLLAALLRHEHASLTLAQQAAGMASGVPLFTSVLNYRHSGFGDRPMLDAAATADDKLRFLVGHEGNNYPLTLSIDDFGAAFKLTIQAARGIDPDLVAAMTRTAITTLVDALERTPTRPIGELDVLPAAAADAMISWGRGPAVAWGDDRCIHHWVEQQVDATPDRVAIRSAGQPTTYRELDERANQLAHQLQRAGVGRGAVVGLGLRRSVEQIVAMLAVFKAGGACVPLDPDYPAERLAYLVHDSGCRLVVTTSATRLATGELPRVDVDLLATGELPRARPAAGVTADDTAYLLYTSGSTGTPKGVIGLHRALTSRLVPERARRDGAEIYGHKTSINFIDSFWETLLPLITGAVIEVLDHATVQDPAELCCALDERRISHVVLVPTLLSAIVGQLETTGRGLPHLAYCVSSGEPLPAELARRVRARLPATELVNIYGTTEFWDATAHAVTDAEPDAGAGLGGPLANIGLYVLDEHRRPVPPGVDGELYVTSPGIGPGYLGKPELTAARFVACPYQPGQTMYRTGDRVRWQAERTLAYRGRVDHQINLRGFRIEPAEIERALTSAPGVGEAVVIARGQGDDARLAGYVTPAPDADAVMGFGLFYFSDSGTSSTTDDMGLYIETVRRADQLGFDAVWTPERHFTRVGAAFPNPSVLSAAAAMVTTRVQLRSGSVVLPLHSPVRVAEEWAVVDRLSGGRVALSFASGWVPNDFVLSPDDFKHRHDVMLRRIEQVRTLWRGGTISLRNGVGAMVDVAIQPRPIQAELPTWITAAGSPRTFEDAGRLGAHVLTHVLNTTVAGLADKIASYRRARKQAGFDPQTGKVALMLHTYVRDDAAAAGAEARPHLEDYFRSQLKLRKDVGESLGLEVHTDQALSDEVITLAANRYLATKALIGSPASCAALLQELQDVGVDEIACLIDFGLPSTQIMAGLESLDRLRRASVRRLRPSALRDQLASALPSHMVPDTITVLDKLPLTPSGKLDRRALPDPVAPRNAGRAYVAPRNSIETALAAIWAEVLQRDRVGVTDSFFDLGGNSMAAIRMINRAQKALGLKISMRELFERQTISAVIASPASASRVLQLSPGADGRALFCVHGGTGNAAFYAKLSAHVGRDVPLYALEYPGLVADGARYASVPELARDYVARVREIQPRGPYQLLGWSFGGLTAFEMARQLQVAGETTAFLALVDSPIATESFSPWSDGDALRYLLKVHGVTDGSAATGLDALKARQVVPESFGADDLTRSLGVVRDIVGMRMRYRPERYRGDVAYIAAADGSRDAAIAGWRAIIDGDVVTAQVDVAHDRMFDDAHIGELGAAVSAALARARA